MLLASIILLFVVGYLVIALEHPLHIDKAATSLFIGAGCTGHVCARDRHAVDP